MRKTDWKTVVIAVLLALVVVMVANGNDRPAFGSTDGNADMIAVTGEYGNGTSVLWVIDTKSRHMAAYRSLNGTSIELVGARRIEHDLRLLSFRDNSPEGYSPLDLERGYLKFKDRAASPEAIPAAGAPTTEPEKK